MIRANDILSVITTPTKLLEVIKGCGYFYLNAFMEDSITSKLLLNERLEKCRVCKVYYQGVCDSTLSDEVVQDFSYHGEDRKKGELKNGCGCIISCKGMLPVAKCPLGKW